MVRFRRDWSTCKDKELLPECCSKHQRNTRHSSCLNRHQAQIQAALSASCSFRIARTRKLSSCRAAHCQAAIKGTRTQRPGTSSLRAALLAFGQKPRHPRARPEEWERRLRQQRLPPRTTERLMRHSPVFQRRPRPSEPGSYWIVPPRQ
jgi:hypothetical protein